MERPNRRLDAPRHQQRQWVAVGQIWAEQTRTAAREAMLDVTLAEVPEVEMGEPMPTPGEMSLGLQDAIAGYDHRGRSASRASSSKGGLAPMAPRQFFEFDSQTKMSEQSTDTGAGLDEGPGNESLAPRGKTIRLL